jgi:hypothetical protein
VVIRLKWHGVRDTAEGGFVRLAVPTTAPPGSPEKVAVLLERAKRGLALFNPLDANVGERVGILVTRSTLGNHRLVRLGVADLDGCTGVWIPNRKVTGSPAAVKPRS